MVVVVVVVVVVAGKLRTDPEKIREIPNTSIRSTLSKRTDAVRRSH